ncbi:MAG: hypothetical protein ACRDN6_06615 [Gaiellaceae bacterium]
MSSRRNRSRRLLVTVLFAGVLASAAYAFTASNTVPGTTAGQGATAISGYSATSVAYNLNATTPSNIDSVAFTLSPAAAATVKIQLVTAGSWYSCTNTAGSVSCATTSPQATVAAANNLSVLAVQ